MIRSRRTRIPGRRLGPMVSLLLLSALAPTQEPPPGKGRPPGGGKPPRILSLPSGVRFVLLERPGEFLTFAATFVAAGTASEGIGEEGISQVLAEESLHGTWALGSPGWEKERRWLARRDKLLEEEARARLQGKAPSLDLEKRRNDLDRLLLEQTRPLAWLARLEGDGAAGIATWADVSGFGLKLAIPSSHAGRFLSLEAVRFRCPALRRVVEDSRSWRARRSRALREDSRLRGRSLLLGEAFRIHPRRRYLALPGPGPILWSKAQAFWSREVLPERVVLALVGPVSPGLDRLIRELWGRKLPSSTRPLPLTPPSEPPQEGPRTLHAQVEKGEEGALLGWRLPGKTGRAALRVLVQLLGNQATGWIPALLARDRGLFRDVLVEAPFPGPGSPALFLVELTPREGDKPSQAAETLLQFLPTWAPKPEEVELAKGRVLADLQEERDSPSRLASILAEEEACGRGALAWWDLPAQVRAVTGKEVLDLARRIFQPKNRNLVLLEGPENPGGRK